MGAQLIYVLVEPLYKCVRCQAIVTGLPTPCPPPETIDTWDHPILSDANIFHGCNETEIGVCTLIGADVIKDDK